MRSIKIFRITERAVIGTALLCFMAMTMVFNSSAARNGSASTFMAPDFAFPQEVRAEAQKVYDQSMKDGDAMRALMAAMELNVAGRLISRADSIVPTLERYQRIASGFEAPYSSLARLLEATVLADVYSSNRYVYNQRKLPAEKPDAEPTLWSGEQFRLRVGHLLAETLKEKSRLDATSIGEISLILTNGADAVAQGMTAYDFAIYKIIRLAATMGLQNINTHSLPFKVVSDESDYTEPTSSEGLPDRWSSSATNDFSGIFDNLRLIDSLIAEDERGAAEEPARAGALCHARLQRLDYIQDSYARKAYVRSLLNLYPSGNPLRPRVLLYIYNNSGLDDEEAYALLSAAAKEYPQSPEATCLKSICSKIVTPSLSFHSKSQWLSDGVAKIYCDYKNVDNVHVLLVPVSVAFAESRNPKIRNISPAGKVRNLSVYESAVKAPYALKDTIVVDVAGLNLNPGYYAIVPSVSQDLAGVPESMLSYQPVFVNVSDLYLFSSVGDEAGVKSNAKSRGKIAYGRLYVTDARNNNPVSGAQVVVKNESYGRGRGETVSLRSDSEGSVELPYQNASVVVTHNGHRVTWSTYSSSEERKFNDQLVADIFTDLGIYHPGDSVNAAVVVAKSHDNILAPADSVDVTLKLMDTNWKEVEQKKLTTDEFGRVSASFEIPSAGLTGTFRLLAINAEGSRIGSAGLEVADYKSPSFSVTLDSPEVDASSQSPEIILSGNVSTYSGMPVAEAEVQIQIDYRRILWRYFGGVDSGGSFGHKVTTDSRGRFTLTLEADSARIKNYEGGVFTVTAAATDAAGETQSSVSRRFTLSEGYALNSAVPSKLEAVGDSITFSIKVTDILGNPTRKNLDYEVSDADGHTIAEGEFASSELNLPASILPSGSYRIRAILKDAQSQIENDKRVWRNDTADITTVIWRMDDKIPPMKTPVWTPVAKIYADSGAKTVGITVGNPYSGDMIYYEVADFLSVVDRGWLKPDGKNIILPVAAPCEGEMREVTFFGVHNGLASREQVAVYPAADRVRMEIAAETFRDKINPGQNESWKFRLYPSEGTLPGGVAVATMSNAALEAIAPFSWIYDPSRILMKSGAGNIGFMRIGEDWFSGPMRSGKGYTTTCGGFELPEWNFWGYSPYGIFIRGTRRYMSTAKAAGNIVRAEEVVDEVMNTVVTTDAPMAFESMKYSNSDIADLTGSIAESEEEKNGADGGEMRQEMPLRDMECPLAFFMPGLTADNDGNILIEFTAPNFNTTWNLRLLGYDGKMRGRVEKFTAVASKPVMVATNMPRFLLTGDKAQISATIFNNYESELEISGSIEVFEIASGKVVARVDSPAERMLPSASRVINVKFDVGTDYSQLGVRATATSSRGSDGEQGLLQVLPAAQPVNDAYSLYLLPGRDSAEIKLPRLKEGDQVTLNYCSNPSWYALTSLSGLLKPDSESALCLADAFFANEVSAGLLTRYPKLNEGLRKMLAVKDSALISPLQKNAGLKLLPLNSTPWVNNAENETQRMAGLASLLDAKSAVASEKEIVGKLKELQQPDGGWSWMKKMPASVFITRSVLGRFADLKTLGYLPGNAELKSMIKSGLKYADAEFVKDYKEVTQKNKSIYPLSAEVEYFRMRDAIAEGDPSGMLLHIKNEMLRRLSGEWRDLSIRDKAMAAIVLNSSGNSGLAQTILESIRQFASYKKDKGMWFDNLEGGYFGSSPLIVTADCLQAFAEIMPDDSAKEGLCQYLVLSRQTQDWNNHLGAGGVAKVVASVMQSVPSWAEDEGDFSITLDGVALAIPSGVETLAGGFYMDIDPKIASGKTLAITKSGASPAWGGVLNRHVAEISDVKSHSVPQLKIEKSLLPISVDESGVKAAKSSTRFKKGERIRVTLTVTTDRALDYLLISDGRSACMQPADQLTDYVAQDGLWMLRETRDYSTNFYFMSIPKGRHIISYDVYADRDGEYSCGLAEAQSQYYPMISAHSAGTRLKVGE